MTALTKKIQVAISALAGKDDSVGLPRLFWLLIIPDNYLEMAEIIAVPALDLSNWIQTFVMNSSTMVDQMLNTDESRIDYSI